MKFIYVIKTCDIKRIIYIYNQIDIIYRLTLLSFRNQFIQYIYIVIKKQNEKIQNWNQMIINK